MRQNEILMSTIRQHDGIQLRNLLLQLRFHVKVSFELFDRDIEPFYGSGCRFAFQIGCQWLSCDKAQCLCHKGIPGITDEEVARWAAERQRAPFVTADDFDARVALGAAARSALRL